MFRVWTALVLLVGLALPVHAQVVGQIQGTVRDAQGGVLPGVSLTLRNVDTGVQRTTTSEADGTYRFAGLQPGTYEVQAELQGFATVAVDRLTVTIGLDLRQDISMQVQALQETITVSAEAPVIEVTKAEVAQVISSSTAAPRRSRRSGRRAHLRRRSRPTHGGSSSTGSMPTCRTNGVRSAS